MITSADNAKLKEARRLTRKRDRGDGQRFVAEGEDLVAAAKAAGWHPVELLVAADSGLEGTEVEPELLAKASSLGSGTRVIGIYEERWAPLEPDAFTVAVHGLRDPGNVGTILRSARAFGAQSVVIGPNTADPFGPKAVRASMGAIFEVPVARWTDALPKPVIALVAREGEVLRGPLTSGTLVVGAEREGLPREVVERADVVAHIPIESESLNAAMAATVALYEARRPRP